MVASVKLWLLESSSSIAKASILVIMLKSRLLNFCLQLGHVLRRRQHLLSRQLNGRF